MTWQILLSGFLIAAMSASSRAEDAPRPVIYQLMVRTFGNSKQAPMSKTPLANRVILSLSTKPDFFIIARSLSLVGSDELENHPNMSRAYTSFLSAPRKNQNCA